MLALAIQRRLARGTDDDEIEQLIERFKRDNGVVFTVGTLEYLQKGGRIGRAQALAGTLLNVKPILSVADGVIVPIGKVRGRQRALQEFARVFTGATEDTPGLRVAIAHADAPEWVDVLTDLVQKLRPQAEIELVEALGAVVGTHAGPGAVGFFWFHDP
jgi:DegV family protein with EDD domain